MHFDIFICVDSCILRASRLRRKLDRENALRFSHENPSVIKCYENYLQKPLSHRAHELLHTEHKAWLMPDEPQE